MVTYEIRKGIKAPCELWRVIKEHGESLVCEGTYTYCSNERERVVKAERNA